MQLEQCSNEKFNAVHAMRDAALQHLITQSNAAQRSAEHQNAAQ
jgi:hypothetical protein